MPYFSSNVNIITVIDAIEINGIASTNVNIITVIDAIEINGIAKKMSIKLLCISDR